MTGKFKKYKIYVHLKLIEHQGVKEKTWNYLELLRISWDYYLVVLAHKGWETYLWKQEFRSRLK